MRRDFVGQKIRALRKERGMTQSQLASRIGIIQSDLCRMEKGEYRVGLDCLFRILEVFGLEIGEFFAEKAQARPLGGRAGGPMGSPTRGVDGWQEQQAEVGGPELEQPEAELLAGFRRLGPERRQEVLDYLRFQEAQDVAPGRQAARERP